MKMMGGTARKALDMAQAVDARQTKHEEKCDLRQGQIRDDLKEVRDILKKAMWLLLTGAAAVLYDVLKSKGVL